MKCSECGAIFIENKIPAFHGINCSKNTLSLKEWHAEDDKRKSNLLKYLDDTLAADKKAKSLTYFELSQFLLENVLCKGNWNIEEESIIERIRQILEELQYRNN